MPLNNCCIKIKPQWVRQWGSLGLSRTWSPILPIEEGDTGISRVWDTAFSTINWLSEYPDELKQECFVLPDGGSASFEIHADLFDDDFNCWEVNRYNQEVLARYVLDICKPMGMTFGAQGHVERKDLYFDFIIVRVLRLWPAEIGGVGVANEWETIIFEHGTGEDIDCEMANKICCAKHVFDTPGRFLLDIQIATGDGLHHKDFEWNLAWDIFCNSTPDCDGGLAACEHSEPPITPPPHPSDGGDNEPPYGQSPPAPGDPPTPGYRGDCSCDNCILQGIAVTVSGLPNGGCHVGPPVLGDPCINDEYEQKDSGLNGGYVLTKGPTGAYEQFLGTSGDVDDMGELVGKFTRRYDSSILGCDPGPDGITSETEVYCYLLTGHLVCIPCMVGDAPGVKWEADITPQYQARSKVIGGDWEMASVMFGPLCGNNLEANVLIEQECEVPPGCNGSVTYTNGANTIQIDPCDCVIDSSFTTIKFEPVGVTTLCTPI